MGTNIRQRGDGGMDMVDDATSKVFATIGGTGYRNLKIAVVPLKATTATTGGAIAAWANPEGSSIVISRLMINVTTKSTGAANLSVGVAADGVTSSANLIDTYAIGSTEKVVDTAVDGSTNGKENQLMTATQFVTFSAGATTAGLVAIAYIKYFVL